MEEISNSDLEELKRQTESTVEKSVKEIHKKLNESEGMELSTGEKLYLICGLIMAGLPTEGLISLSADNLMGNNSESDNDGIVILKHINEFLNRKECSKETVNKIMSLLNDAFSRPVLWKTEESENSIFKSLFLKIQKEIVPCLTSGIRLDFAGLILNCLNDWAGVDKDEKNDVVLTPRYVTYFMAQLAKTDMDSYVWDRAMGSGGFLVSALDIMESDARAKISDETKLKEKIDNIYSKQIFGIEFLDDVYILAVLNMILMGNGTSKILCGDSHEKNKEYWEFPATVFLLNPPYSAPGKGLDFVAEALETMKKGRACVLIQENAGSGRGTEYAQKILENNTLIASIHMPTDLMKASVQTAIYLFEVNRPHKKDDLVKFIDMSEDGYKRRRRKKSTQAMNCQNVDNAEDRYNEVVARVLERIPNTEYYTEENGLFFTDTIAVEGEEFGKDWTFAQHKKIDIVPTEEDFEKTVFDYLIWKMGFNHITYESFKEKEKNGFKPFT